MASTKPANRYWIRSKAAASTSSGKKAGSANGPSVLAGKSAGITKTSASKGKGKAKNRSENEDQEDGDDDEKGQRFGYNDAIADAVPMRTPVPLLPIGAVEFLTFLPYHTQWPTLFFRLARHRWGNREIAKVMLHARGRLTRAHLARRINALRRQLNTSARAVYGTTAFQLTTSAPPHPHWIPFVDAASGDNTDLYHTNLGLQGSGHVYEPPRDLGALSLPATLSDLINGVVNWPTGQDAGVLTQALQWARVHRAGQLADLTTDDLDGIIQAQNLQSPSDATTHLWDVRALVRVRRDIRNPTT